MRNIHYVNYASPNVKWGVKYCAYPILPRRKESPLRSESLLKKWRNNLGVDNICCVTGIQAAAKELHAHHLYGFTGYPELIYEKDNGVLLFCTLHLEFHKSVRKPEEITLSSLFCKKLETNDSYLIKCVTRITKYLEQNNYFTTSNTYVLPNWLVKSRNKQLIAKDLCDIHLSLNLLVEELKKKDIVLII